LPSEIINVEDEYVAYCFNQACSYAIGMIQDGKKPVFDEDRIKGRKVNEGLQTLINT